MKMQNPFNRLKKKEFVPLSLFPCSKVTRTSMDIARATPVYYCEMMQGNKISIDAAQLTRFASLDVPTMNEYEVGLGAYFVPYVSFDEYFNNHTINKYAKTNSDFCNKLTRCALHARDFFNPSLDNALRVHPIKLSADSISGTPLVGSLYDHLGYYIGQNETIGGYYRYNFATQYGSPTETYRDTELMSALFTDSITYFRQSESSLEVHGALYDKSYIGQHDIPAIIPFDLRYLNAYVDKRANFTSADLTELNEKFDSSYGNDNYYAWALLVNAFTGTQPIENFDYEAEWSKYFGNVTKVALVRDYQSYVESVMRMHYCGLFQLNVVKALAYYRIYADWFIDDTIMHKDDFLAVIGGAYTYLANGFSKVQLAFDYVFTDILSDTSNPIRIFYDDLKFGRCLPVPAEKNYFTACKPTQTNNTFTDFKYSGNGVAETPIGATIHENFFNRAYQRFKDFVTRLGYDYRRNTAGLYGHDSNDDSLISSQLFGSATFDVKVGDIAQTSETTSTSQQGNLAGIAMSKGGSSKWTFTANENGCVMILAWIRPKSYAIAGAIDRSMFKSDYNDYLNPMFGGVAMQDVLIDELYPKSQNVNQKFGVTEIYSEYMSVNNEVSGLMRTTAKKWNADRILDTKPAPLTSPDGVKLLYLNNDWYDDLNRNFMDTETSPILTTLYFTGNVTRQLPEAIRTDF